MVTVVGLATLPSRRYLSSRTRSLKAGVAEPTLERYRAAVPIAIQPIVIQQENDVGDGLKREWDAPDLGIENTMAMHSRFAHRGHPDFHLLSHVRKRAQESN
jgi:hypothetical protein